MLLEFFQRVKVILVVCLLVSVAFPTVSHAFEMKSVMSSEEAKFSTDDATSQASDNKNTDHESDGCDCCHSSCCNLTALSKTSILSHSFGMERIAFPIISDFLTGTIGSSLFRPPKPLV